MLPSDQVYLHQAFQKGKAISPKGFYRGRLLKLFPKNLVEQLGKTIASIYIPWLGKSFDQTKHEGSNIMPSFLQILLAIKYPDAIKGHQHGGVYAFPFTTTFAESLGDKTHVLRLSYDRPENPTRIRHVVDEVVQIENNVLLGKAFLIEERKIRLVAFFELRRNLAFTFN